MPFYEYKVVPSPEKTPKARGLKGPARFASALQQLMNDLAQDGWEYQRAESLPDEERKGLTGRTEVTRHVLVFRRELYFEEEPGTEDAAAEGRQDLPYVAGPSPDEGTEHRDGPPTGREEAEATEDEEAAAPHDEAPDEENAVPRFSRRPLVAERRSGPSDS